ncbi:MAG: NUDIX domain-containing protein [Planctomycetes bacterium]|nr:NUDIX domain-containing protein [Planctomycetota bacterium]
MKRSYIYFLEIIAGIVDNDDESLQAVVRELHEEVDLDVKAADLVELMPGKR